MNDIKYTFNLGQLFSEVVYENPNNIAIKEEDGLIITYKELDDLSNRISNYLILRGVQKEQVIVILNNKSFISYALMIACLKLGVIYTNIDSKSPIERFKKMLDICRPAILFYSGNDKPSFVNVYESEFTDYDSEQFKSITLTLPTCLNKLNSFVVSSNPAYIMFTSGSTGFPKGVLIPHSSIINFIQWTKSTYNTINTDSFTNLNPMHFDNSVFDFYASLFTGASLIPVKEYLTKNPRKLLNVLNELKPTIWFSVPSMLVYMLNMRALKQEDLSNLRVVTFGGEGFPKNKLRELWKSWGKRVRFVNVYGPTECTCICSSYDVTEKDIFNDDLLPLGPIAPNFKAFILDDNNKLVKDGDIGELCIGGPNVGYGYFNNIDKTDEVFIDNPLISSHSEKIYKSGDIVCYDSKINSYIFKGRKDNQIKRMGYRIELEEIENSLNIIDFIQESAVIYVNNEIYKSKIIACVISSVLDENKIIMEISRYLPSYMLPDKIEFLDTLPKNQNGKIDRLSLKSNYN